MGLEGKLNLKKFEQVAKKVETLSQYELKVGHFDEIHRKRGQANVASISYWTEYGSLKHNREPRPLMSRSHSNFQSKLQVKSAQFLSNHLGGNVAATKAIDIVGQAYVEEIQATILAGGFSPLKDSTIKQKGHDTQLIDTEQLYDSTKYKFKKAQE